jgi:hypothetical protein
MASKEERSGVEPITTGVEGGTREYPGDSGEYPGGTGEYPSSDASKAEPREEATAALPRELPWWQREGYSSLAEALAEEIAMGDRVMGRKPRDLEGLDLEEVVLSQPEPLERRSGNPRPRGRQVNVKLTDEEHSKLKQAARDHGLPPATLARVFVVRATEVALRG